MRESSGLSDLINSMHSRRLQTDPSDALLFEPPTQGAPRARREQARWFESPVVEPAHVPASQSAAPTRPARKPVAPAKPDRGRVRLLIVATIASGVLGVYGASRIHVGDDPPVASIANVAPAATQPTLEAAPPAPVVRASGTASAPAIDTSVQPSSALVVNTNAPPTVAPRADTNASAVPPATPTHHRAIKRRKAIVNRHERGTKQSTVQPAAVAPARKQIAKPSSPAAQSSDSEGPL